jgi:hypothetical protein
MRPVSQVRKPLDATRPGVLSGHPVVRARQLSESLTARFVLAALLIGGGIVLVNLRK